MWKTQTNLKNYKKKVKAEPKKQKIVAEIVRLLLLKETVQWSFTFHVAPSVTLQTYHFVLTIQCLLISLFIHQKGCQPYFRHLKPLSADTPPSTPPLLNHLCHVVLNDSKCVWLVLRFLPWHSGCCEYNNAWHSTICRLS